MNNFMKFAAIAIALFIAALIWVIGPKHETDTASLLILGGMIVGILIATPAAVVLTYLAIRRRAEHDQ